MTALLLALLLALPAAQAPPQGRGAGPLDTTAPDPAYYAVAYVETTAATRPAATAALRAYREACAKQDGCVRVEAFEQIGRPGHWVIYETWRDQKAFDARPATVPQQLLDALGPMR